MVPSIAPANASPAGPSVDSSESAGRSATVAVLLCTFNGTDFLAQQLESIGEQQGPVVRVHVSDDGSEDDTLAILHSWRERWGEDRLVIWQGPGRGHVANFFSLVCSPQIDAGYFAYADQDDIWDADKLSRAVAALAGLPPDRPALYCSRTRLISETGQPLGYSPLFRRPPGFANALVHNIGGGNTMVLNRCARELLRAAGAVDVVSHDWWTYLLVAGAGGTVIYDAQPSLSYRQHGHNLVGSNMGARQRMARMWMALHNRNREWNDRNIDALRQSQSLLSGDSRDILEALCQARNARLVPRLLGVWRSGVYAQSFTGNLGVLTAAFLNKI